MHSKHAFILVLMAGAAGLVVALAGFLSIEYLNRAEPFLGANRANNEVKAPMNAPRLLTKLEGTTVQIVEVDADNVVQRVLYTSELSDRVADFSLFAVPQTAYQGLAYVQSTQDADSSTLIIYPLQVDTGKLLPSVINIPSADAQVSLDQARVAVLNLNQVPQVAAYDLATGLLLASWSLAPGERLTEKVTYGQNYTGTGVNWISNECFEHPVWLGSDVSSRLFCLQNE